MHLFAFAIWFIKLSKHDKFLKIQKPEILNNENISRNTPHSRASIKSLY